MNKILIAIAIFFLSSCADHSLKNYQDESPKLELRNFFNGKIYALGIVQDRSGKVIQRFKVDILATWNSNVATLDEKFSYSDGSKSTRIWELTEKDGRLYEGRAGDVVGVANGEVSGNAFFFEYIF